MKNLILIKLGGSVITNKKKAYSLRSENLIRLAKEIKSALNKKKARVIIGHGAGSFAHIPASIYKTKEGFINKNSPFGMCVTEEAARWLNEIVIKKFISEKLPVFPFSPGSFLISDAKVYLKSYLDPLKTALANGIIPVVYGDVIVDKKQGCAIFSTEKVFAVLVKELSKEYQIRQILVSDVDGVYDGEGKIIPVINTKNFNGLKPSITSAKGVDVTGGMLHKVEEALSLVQKTGFKTQIINGTKAGYLKKAILGKKVIGTTVR